MEVKETAPVKEEEEEEEECHPKITKETTNCELAELYSEASTKCNSRCGRGFAYNEINMASYVTGCFDTCIPDFFAFFCFENMRSWEVMAKASRSVGNAHIEISIDPERF